MNAELEPYFKEISENLLVCPTRRRSAFLQELRGNIDAYVQDHPAASAQEVQSVFGSPREIAESFFASLDFKAAARELRIKKRITRIVTAVVCVLVAGILVLGTIYVVDNHGYAHGYWGEGPATSATPAPTPDDAISTY